MSVRTKAAALAFGLVVASLSELFAIEIARPQPSLARPERASQSWRQSISKDPMTGSQVPFILKTADLDSSDFDFVGMMVRCTHRAIEPVLVLADPVPPQLRPSVTLSAANSTVSLTGTPIPSGAGLLLSIDLPARLDGVWRNATELSVSFNTDSGFVKGVVQIGGLPDALTRLQSACRSARAEPN